MTAYAIGDVQGCLDELQQLLSVINFRPDCDELWLTGDLVSRGPKSLDTLRFVKSLGDAAVVTLGNHDLHLLASAQTQAGQQALDADLRSIVEADDAADLLEWLRRRPMLHHDAERGITMIHAGLPPEWSLDCATSLANELEDALRGSAVHDFYGAMYGNRPKKWRSDLEGNDRLRFICNCLTRLRYLDSNGKMALKVKESPDTADKRFQPWFAHPERETRSETLIFGHWSTLSQVHWPDHNVYGIDTGCVWGGTLTAVNLDQDMNLTRVSSPGYQKPG